MKNNFKILLEALTTGYSEKERDKYVRNSEKIVNAMVKQGWKYYATAKDVNPNSFGSYKGQKYVKGTNILILSIV